MLLVVNSRNDIKWHLETGEKEILLWTDKVRLSLAEHSVQFSSVQLLRHVRLFVTPWTVKHQASLSITISRSSPKLMPIKLVMPSNHLILCCLLLPPSIFPSISVFSNESALCIRWENTGVSASTSFLPMNIQD